MRINVKYILALIPDATKLAIAIAAAVGEVKGFIKAHAGSRKRPDDAAISALSRIVSEATPVARTLPANHPLHAALRDARQVLADLGITIVDIQPGAYQAG